MDESINDKLPETYRQILKELSDLKVKQIKLKDLENKLSTDQYNSLLKKFNEESDFLNSELANLESKLNGNISMLMEGITKTEKELVIVDTKIKDIEVLGKNELIDSMQYQKEKKILGKKKTSLQNQLGSHQKELESIELILKYPDPTDEAKAIADRESKKKAEMEAKQKAEIEKKELEEKRKWDFKYQVDQKVKVIQDKADASIDQLNKDIEKYKVNIEYTNAENLLLKEKFSELETSLEVVNKKADKYKNKIEDIHYNYRKNFILCPDEECDGDIGFDGFCNKCSKDYQKAKTDWKKRLVLKIIKHKIAKSNLIFKRLVIFEMFFLVIAFFIQNEEIMLPFILILSVTCIIWAFKHSGYNVELLNLKEYGTQEDVDEYLIKHEMRNYSPNM